MNERLTRRGALLALGGLAAGAYVGIKLRPFVEALGQPQETSVDADRLVPFIQQTSEFFVPRTPGSNENTFSKVSINKRQFAQAILDVAAFSGRVSPSRIYTLLRSRPLKITLTRKTPPGYIYDGKFISGDQEYRPYWYQGPEITIFEQLILSCQRSLADESHPQLSLRYLNDTFFYHEIRHLVQDMDNPLKHVVDIAISNTKDGFYHLVSFKKGFNPHQEPFEVNAQAVGEGVALAKLKTYSGPNSVFPLGRFLTFS